MEGDYEKGNPKICHQTLISIPDVVEKLNHF